MEGRDEYCNDGVLDLGVACCEEETWAGDVVVADGRDVVAVQEVAEEEDKLDNEPCAGVVALLDVETFERSDLAGLNDEGNTRSVLGSPGLEFREVHMEDGGSEVVHVLDGNSEAEHHDNDEDSWEEHRIDAVGKVHCSDPSGDLVDSGCASGVAPNGVTTSNQAR